MRRALAVAVMSALFVTAGCLGFLESGPSDPGAEAVAEEAVTAGKTVETYRVQTQLEAEGQSNHGEEELDVTSEGAVDRSARKVRLVANRDDTNRTVYVIGNTTYTQCTSPWSGWGKEVRGELDADWNDYDPLGRQLKLLEQSPITWVGNETHRGTAVDVIEAHPSDRTLTQFSQDQAQINLFGPRIENASLKAWIAADSSHVLKTHLSFTIHKDDVSIETRMTTRFTDYGTTVDISLPSEATENPFKHGCPGE